MKRIILLSMIFLLRQGFAQSVKVISEDDTYIHLLGSGVHLSNQENFLRANFGSYIEKDSIYKVGFILTFFYNSPEHVLFDSSDEVEIYFTDGEKYALNKYDINHEEFDKDSLTMFICLADKDFVKKLVETDVESVSIQTKSYTYNTIVDDTCRSNLSKLAESIVIKSNDVFVKYSKGEKVSEDNQEVFSPEGNKLIDKKYLGKYSGEWRGEDITLSFDLYIKTDTSYFIWSPISKNGTNKKSFTNQVVNVRTDESTGDLLLIVCFDDKKEYESTVVDKYKLSLSENGKVLYGTGMISETNASSLYGIRKKKY